MQAKIIQRGDLKLVVDANDIWNSWYITEEQIEKEFFEVKNKARKTLDYKDYFYELLRLNRFVEKIRDEKLKIDIFNFIPLTKEGEFNRKETFIPLAECTITFFYKFRAVGIKTVTSLDYLHYNTKDADLNISEEECKAGNVAVLSTQEYYGKRKEFPLDLNGKLTGTNYYIFNAG